MHLEKSRRKITWKNHEGLVSAANPASVRRSPSLADNLNRTDPPGSARKTSLFDTGLMVIHDPDGNFVSCTKLDERTTFTPSLSANFALKVGGKRKLSRL